jgi:hypothetical protein
MLLSLYRITGRAAYTVRDAATGPRRADRLVQVWRRDGHDLWLLLHLEVQSQPEQAFPKRMFTYYYRILDYHDHEVVGPAILADTRISWRPDTYRQTRWGCDLRYHYPVAKLADWRTRQAALEESTNPFATIVLAHLAAQATRRQPAAREQVKLQLVRRLYDRGYDRERILSPFRFIDWLLARRDNRCRT